MKKILQAIHDIPYRIFNLWAVIPFAIVDTFDKIFGEKK